MLRVADSEQERSFTLDGQTHVDVFVEIPRGRSLLQIKTDPAATSEEDAIVLRFPRAERTSSTADLRAELISPDSGFE